MGSTWSPAMSGLCSIALGVEVAMEGTESFAVCNIDFKQVIKKKD